MEPSATPTPSVTASRTNTPPPTVTNTPTTQPIFTPTPTLAGLRTHYTNTTAFLSYEMESPLALNQIVFGTVDDNHPAILFPYQARVGQVVDIEMTNESSTLDMFVLVIDPKGREVARATAAGPDAPSLALRGISITEAGQYVIAASRYMQLFGRSSGDFSLRVVENRGGASSGLFSSPVGYGAVVRGGPLNAQNPEQIYTLRGTAGDVITITMNAVTGDLDPRLGLSDNLGNLLALVDDDLAAGVIDSAIVNYTLPHTGYYSIIATRFMGNDNGGEYQLRVSLVQPSSGTPATVIAPLDPENSTTYRVDGQLFINYSAGDSLDQENDELATMALLTFFIPPLEAGAQVEHATLELAPCYETGSGFSALGAMTIYHDPYGSLTVRADFSRPFAGARILSTQSDCSPLDVTALVANAYNTGEHELQFRIVFRNNVPNNQGDEVWFTPRLLIQRGS